MRTLEMSLSGLDAPPVDNGEALLSEAMRNLTSAHSTVTTASRRLERAKVADKKSLQQAVDQIGKAFGPTTATRGPSRISARTPR